MNKQISREKLMNNIIRSITFEKDGLMYVFKISLPHFYDHLIAQNEIVIEIKSGITNTRIDTDYPYSEYAVMTKPIMGHTFRSYGSKTRTFVYNSNKHSILFFLKRTYQLYSIVLDIVYYEIYI